MEEEVQEDQEVQDKQITVSSSLLCGLCAVVALILLIVCKICLNFNVSTVKYKGLYGTLSIFYYVLPLCGTTLSYIVKKKPTMELWMNLAVLAISLMTF